jgi:hypothetical protein
MNAFFNQTPVNVWSPVNRNFYLLFQIIEGTMEVEEEPPDDNTNGLRLKGRGIQKKTGSTVPVVECFPMGSLGGYQTGRRETHGNWNGVARNNHIKQALYEGSTLIGFVRITTLQLATFHILRCFENGDPITDVSSNGFWYYLFKASREMLYQGGVKLVDKIPPKIYESARTYEQTQLPQLPQRCRLENGVKVYETIKWEEDNCPGWRDDCLKAAGKMIATNFGIMHGFEGYRGKLLGVVSQFVDQLHEFPTKVSKSMKSAIMRSLHLNESLDEVRGSYPNLNNLDDITVQQVQENIIDTIRPVMSTDFSNVTTNLRSVYDLRMLLAETFPNQPTEHIPQESVEIDIGSLPLWSQPCEVVANEMLLATELNTKARKKLVRRAVDLMRMSNHSLVEMTDVGLKNNKQFVSRRCVVLKLITDAIFGTGVIDFSTQSLSRLLTEEEKGWCCAVAEQWKYPSSTSTENEVLAYFKCLEMYVRRLQVPQRVVINTKPKGKKQRTVKFPSLCPLASKRAAFISFPNDAITKLVSSLAKAKKITIDEKTEALKKHMVKMKEPWDEVNPKSNSKKRKYDVDFSEEEITDRKNSYEQAKIAYDEACWRILFKIQKRNGWKFDGKLITDGVSVYGQYYRPQTPQEIYLGELKQRISKQKALDRENKAKACRGGTCSKDGCCGHEKKKKGKKKEKTTLSPDEQELLKAQEDEMNLGMELARKILNNPDHRQPRFIDPGASGHEGIVFDQEAFDTMHRPSGQNKHFERISLRKKEMSSKTGHGFRKFKVNEWTMADENQAVRDFNEHAPSKNQLRADTFLNNYCLPTNEALHEVYGFYSQNCFRRLRFHVAGRERKMLEDAVSTICGTDNPKEQKETVVVMGDAAVNAGKCGHSRIAHGKIVKRLKHKCIMVMVDEFRSSQRCFCCHEALVGAPVAEGRSSQSFKIRTCLNTYCHRIFLQRDLNAAINIAKFFFWLLNGTPFPPEFTRGRGGQAVEESESEDDDDDDDLMWQPEAI